MPTLTLDRSQVQRLRERLLKTPAKPSDYPKRFEGAPLTGKGIVRLSGRQGLEDYRLALAVRLAEPIFRWPRGRAKEKYAVVRVYARPGEAPATERAKYTKRGTRRRPGIPAAQLRAMADAFDNEFKKALAQLRTSFDANIRALKSRIKSTTNSEKIVKLATELERLEAQRSNLAHEATRSALSELAKNRTFGKYVRYISEYET